MRARILAGVATFVVASALAPTEASAQLLGTCPGLTPPPCIINDPGRIAGTIAEIKEKKQELEAAIQQVKEYTTLNGALGAIGAAPAQLRAAITPPQNQAFEALTEQGPKITISAASNALDGALSSYPSTTDGDNQAKREHALRLRASAGEGYAMATATKYKLCKMNQEARQITSRMLAMDNSANGTDARANWAINQAARRLMLDGLLALREVQTTRLQLSSIKAVPVKGDYSTSGQRVEAEPAEPEISPAYADTIGQIANTANKLVALIAAKEVIDSFLAGIQGSRDTKNEYQQVKAAADKAQADVQNMANKTAREKGISAQQVLTIVNQNMATYDRTTWDDPSKTRAAANAANAAENALDRRVNGDVDNKWSDYLVRRAEAFKQEAFFRPIAADADAMEKQTIQALAQYEQSLGVKASDGATLNAAIASAQSEVDKLKQQLGEAPADVIAKANQIMTSTGLPAGTQNAQPSVSPKSTKSSEPYARI